MCGVVVEYEIYRLCNPSLFDAQHGWLVYYLGYPEKNRTLFKKVKKDINKCDDENKVLEKAFLVL